MKIFVYIMLTILILIGCKNSNTNQSSEVVIIPEPGVLTIESNNSNFAYTFGWDTNKPSIIPRELGRELFVLDLRTGIYRRIDRFEDLSGAFQINSCHDALELCLIDKALTTRFAFREREWHLIGPEFESDSLSNGVFPEPILFSVNAWVSASVLNSIDFKFPHCVFDKISQKWKVTMYVANTSHEIFALVYCVSKFGRFSLESKEYIIGPLDEDDFVLFHLE